MQSLFSRLLFFMFLSLPIYLLLRIFYVKLTNKTFQIQREVPLCLFAVFMVGLLALVFQPGEVYILDGARQQITVWERITTQNGINLVPFYTISGFFKGKFDTRFIINIVANILMFSPMGFFLPLLWERWRKFSKVFFAGLTFSLTIEFTQLFIARSVDIDDIILNTLGVMLGYFAYWIYKKIRMKKPYRTL